MAWDFETDPEYQAKLDWADTFVREEVEPLDYVFPHMQFVPMTPEMRAIIDPLKDQVRAQGLWATHLGPELGGQGYGQLKLALLNEILGRTLWASCVFGTQAPDTGNAEIIAHYGTDEQKAKYLQPLLDGEMFSCYSMTEPHAGADPTMFKTRAHKDGDRVRLAVQDTGPGIPIEHLPHIFDRFYKADASRAGTTIRSGSGLGLSIVQAIAHHHGGEVAAANAAEGGAIFTMWLPAEPPAASIGVRPS